MATKPKKRPRKPKPKPKKSKKKSIQKIGLFRRLWRWAWRLLFGFVIVSIVLVVAFRFINPPTNFYMASEQRVWGSVKQTWVDLEDFSPHMAQSVVAAEDANFCLHVGFDLDAIKHAIEDGARRGASTITQQVAKNVYLWHGRNLFRKGLEAWFTVLIEAFWSKQRIIEVYLNVAEFDKRVFGAAAAARHYFGSRPSQITALQAARMAAILPNPKGRSASRPSNYVRKRTRAILAGARTIAQDGRAECFTISQ